MARTDLRGYRAVRDDVRLAGEHVAHEIVNRVFGRGDDVVAGPAVAIDDLEILVAHHGLAELAGAPARLLSRCVVIIPLGKSDGHADAVVGELLAQHVAVARDRELRRDVRALARARHERGNRRREHDVARTVVPLGSSGRKALTVLAVPMTLTERSHCQSSAVMLLERPELHEPRRWRRARCSAEPLGHGGGRGVE